MSGPDETYLPRSISNSGQKLDWINLPASVAAHPWCNYATNAVLLFSTVMRPQDGKSGQGFRLVDVTGVLTLPHTHTHLKKAWRTYVYKVLRQHFPIQRVMLVRPMQDVSFVPRETSREIFFIFHSVQNRPGLFCDMAIIHYSSGCGCNDDTNKLVAKCARLY